MVHPTLGHARTIASFLLPLTVYGCAEPADSSANGPAPRTVAQSWEASRSAPPPVSSAPAGLLNDADAILTVNGEAIARSRLIDLLLETHGVRLMEQLIGLKAVQQAASDKGITVSSADIEAEYARSLEALLGQTASGDSPALRRQAAENLLDRMLASRNASRSEYMIVMERNAILRKLVAPDVRIEEDALRAEYERLHGARVQIRHIQTDSSTDFQKLLQERAAGAEFGDLAVRYSANRASAERLGLLPPFTADDPDIPEPIRREAFLLPPGQDSNPIFVDGWYHLIRVERRIDPDPVTFDQTRPQVEASLRDRLIDAAMRETYQKLFDEARIEIFDPVLRERFRVSQKR